MDVGKAAGWELAGASDRSANAAYVQKAELGDQKFLIAALDPAAAEGCAGSGVSAEALAEAGALMLAGRQKREVL